MLHFFRRTLCIVLLLSAGAQVGFAHGEGGTYEVKEGEYFIDIGYTPEFPAEGTRVRFDFNLYSSVATSSAIEFSDVWARIQKDDTTYFSGSVHNPSIGPSGFSYFFTEPGVYRISSRFQSDLDVITEASFLLAVATSTEMSKEKEWLQQNVYIILGALTVVVVGFGLWWYIRRLK